MNVTVSSVVPLLTVVAPVVRLENIDMAMVTINVSGVVLLQQEAAQVAPMANMKSDLIS
jgi:hypothetical protein